MTKADLAPRRQFLRYIGVGAVGTGLAGCTSGDDGSDSGDSDNGNGDGGGSTSGGGPVDIKIGVLASLSGPYSALGVDLEAGIEQANRHLEAGVGPFEGVDVNAELVVRDTELDPAVGIRRARELTGQENVDVLVGPVSSTVAGGVQEHANQERTLHLHPISTAERWTGADCAEYTFRATAHTYQNMQPVAERVVEQVGPNFATMGADYAWGRESVGAFIEAARDVSPDVEVLARTWPDLGATDFSSQIQRITNTDADFVLVRQTGADIIRSLKQLDSFGVREQMEVVSSNTHTLARGAPEAATGVIGGVRYTHALREDQTGNTQNARFVEDFRAEHDRLPTTFAHGAYACLQSLVLAAAETGTQDSDELANTLEGFEWQSPKGPMKFRECDHQASQRMWSSRFVMSEELGVPVPEFTEQHALGTNNRPCGENACVL